MSFSVLLDGVWLSKNKRITYLLTYTLTWRHLEQQKWVKCFTCWPQWISLESPVGHIQQKKIERNYKSCLHTSLYYSVHKESNESHCSLFKHVVLSRFKSRVVRILRLKIENHVHHFHEFCALLQANFSTLKLSVALLCALLYDSVCYTSILA